MAVVRKDSPAGCLHRAVLSLIHFRSCISVSRSCKPGAVPGRVFIGSDHAPPSGGSLRFDCDHTRAERRSG